MAYQDEFTPPERRPLSLRERAAQAGSVNYGRPPPNNIPRTNLGLQARAKQAPQPTGPIQPRILAPEPNQNLLGRAATAPQPTGPIQPRTLRSGLQARAAAAPPPTGGPQAIGQNLGSIDDSIRASRVGPRQTGVPDIPALGPSASEGALKDALRNAGSEAGIATGLAYDILVEPGMGQKRDEAIAGLKAKAGLNGTPYQALNTGAEELQRTGLKGFVNRGLQAVSDVNSQYDPKIKAALSLPQGIQGSGQPRSLNEFNKAPSGFQAGLDELGRTGLMGFINRGAQAIASDNANQETAFNTGLDRLMYGTEGNPQQKQPTVSSQKSAPITQAATQPQRLPTGLINGQPYYAPEGIEQNANVPQGGLRVAIQTLDGNGYPDQAAQQPAQQGLQPPTILPWDSQQAYTQSKEDPAYTFFKQVDNEQYRARQLGRAQLENSIIGESSSERYDPKTGRLIDTAYRQDSFRPDLVTMPDPAEAQQRQAALGLQQQELGLKREQFDLEKQQANKPKYSLSNGIIYQPEGEGAVEFNQAQQVQSAAKNKQVSDFLGALQSPELTQEQRSYAMKRIYELSPDLYTKLFKSADGY
jgi:hypothetical protein